MITETQDKLLYITETSDGRVYHQNCVHLRKTQESPPTVPQGHEPILKNNPTPRPVDNPETYIASPSIPKPIRKQDKKFLPSPSNRKLQNISANPSPMTLRPARTMFAIETIEQLNDAFSPSSWPT